MAEDIYRADETFGLKELYEQVNTGPGTSAVDPAITGLGQLAPDFSGSALRINTALRAVGTSWRGQASTGAAGVLGQVAGWADHGGQTARDGGGHVQTYVQSFGYLQSHVPMPEPVPALSSLDKVRNLFHLQTDQAGAIQRNYEAAQAAFQALAAHRQVTEQALAAFPEVNAVPSAASGADGQPLAGGRTFPGGGVPGSAPPEGAPLHSPGGHVAHHGSAAAPGAGTAAGPHGGGTTPAGGGIAMGTTPAGSAGAGHGGTGGGTPTGSAGAGGGGAGAGAGVDGGTGVHVPTAAGSVWSPTSQWNPIDPAPGGSPGTASGGRRFPTTGGPPSSTPESFGRGGPEVPGRGGPESTPRTGDVAPRGPGGGSSGGSAGTARASTSPAGMGPMMGGAGARGAADRQHRNTTFIPSDEPFAVEFDGVAPPVLGVPAKDDT